MPKCSLTQEEFKKSIIKIKMVDKANNPRNSIVAKLNNFNIDKKLVLNALQGVIPIETLREKIVTKGNALQSEYYRSRIKDLTSLDKSAILNKLLNSPTLTEDEKSNALLVVHELIQTLRAEEHIISNNNLDYTEDNNVRDAISKLPYMPLARVASTVGRQIALSQGVKLRNNSKLPNAESLEEMYTIIGQNAIDTLIATTNLIKVVDNVPLTVNRFNNTDNKLITTKTYQGKGIVFNTELLGEEVVKAFGNEIKGRSLTAQDINILQDSELVTIFDTAKYLKRLVIPTLVVQPIAENIENVGTVPRIKDTVNVTDTIDERAKIYQRAKIRVAKQYQPIIKQIQALLVKGVINENSTRKEIVNQLQLTPMATNAVFGLANKSKVGEEDSDVGKEISKSYPIIELSAYLLTLEMQQIEDEATRQEQLAKGVPLEELQKVGKDIDKTSFKSVFKLASNFRLHSIQSVMNFQTDKFFSRAILTTGTRTFSVDSEAFNHFVSYILDETGLTVEQILTDKDLTKQLEYLEQYKGKELDFMVNIASNTAVASTQKVLPAQRQIFKATSIWKYMTMLQAIKDLRNIKNGELTTEVMTAPDAKTSGLMIMLLQSIGKSTSKEVETLLNRLDILDSDTNVPRDLDDLYGVLTKELEAMEEDSKNKGDKLVNMEKVEELKHILALLKADIMPKRELSKKATMPVTYSQGKNSSRVTIANEIVNNIYELDLNTLTIPQLNYLGQVYRQALLNVPNSLLNEEQIVLKEDIDEKLQGAKGKVALEQINRLQKGENNVTINVKVGMKKYFAKNVANTMFNAIQDSLVKPTLDGYKAELKSIYDKILEVANGKEIKVLPPHASLHLDEIFTLENIRIDKLNKKRKQYNLDNPKSKPKKLIEPYTMSQLIKKYGLSMSKTKEVLTPAKTMDDTTLLVSKKLDNLASLFVTIQHALDSYILLKTGEDAKGSLHQASNRFFNVMPIQDATVADAETNTHVMKHYEKNTIETNIKYDFKKELLRTLKVYADALQNDNEKAEIHAFVRVEEVRLQKSLKTKQEVLAKFKQGENKLFGTDKVAQEEIDKFKTPFEKDITQKEKTVDMNTPFDENTNPKGKKSNEVKEETPSKTTKVTDELIQPPEDFVDLGTKQSTKQEKQTKQTEQKQETREKQEKKKTKQSKQKKEDVVGESEEFDLEQEEIGSAFFRASTYGKEDSTLLDDEIMDKKEYKDLSTFFEKLSLPLLMGNNYIASMLYLIKNTPKHKSLNPVHNTKKLLNRMLSKVHIYRLAKKKLGEAYGRYPAIQAFLHTTQWDNYEDNGVKNKLHSYLQKAEISSEKITNEVYSSLEASLAEMTDEHKANTLAYLKVVGLLKFKEFSKNSRLTSQQKNQLVRYIQGTKIGQTDLSLLNNLNTTLMKSALGELYEYFESMYNVDELRATYPETMLEIEQLATTKVALMEKSLNNRNARIDIDLYLTKEYFDTPKEFEVLTYEEYKSFDKIENDSKKGWVVVKVVESTTTHKGLVVLARDAVTGTFNSGVMKTPKYIKGIQINHSKFDGVEKDDKAIITHTDGRWLKFRVTDLNTLNESKDSKAFATSIGNAFFMDDTEAIRQHITSVGVTRRIETVKDAKAIGALVTKEVRKGGNKAHPWFLELNNNVVFSKLPQSIQSNYSKLDITIPDIFGMPNVKYIRNDIKHWVIGEKLINPFVRSDSASNKAWLYYKQAVQLLKIRLVTQSITKLTSDATSNFEYLATRGVPLDFIAKETVNVYKAIGELQDAYAKDMKLRMQGKQPHHVKDHPKAYILEDGIQQSISQELVADSKESTSGLQVTLDNITKAIALNENGEANLFGKLVMKFAKVGGKPLGAEGALLAIGAVLGGLNKDTQVYKAMEKLSNDLAKIKKDEDVVAYINTWVGSPNSIITRTGAGTMVLADTLARGVFYEYLRRKKVNGKKLSHTEAIREVNDSFIDYRVPLTKELQFLSDSGVVLFPMFLARIQKVIYNLVLAKPLTVLGVAGAEVMLNVDFTNVEEANLVNRYIEDTIITNDITQPFSFSNTHPY